MWRRHGRVFMIAGLVKLVHDCVMFLGPYVLEQLLKFLENGGTACKLAVLSCFHACTLSRSIHCLYVWIWQLFMIAGLVKLVHD